MFRTERHHITIEMYYVYVLECLDRSLYIGYSTNLKNRIESHNKGYNFSTKNKLPIKLIFYEAYLSKDDAKRREQYLKTTKGKTTLRTMLKDYLEN
ncbi:MAG: putative endonuclease [Candidatus Berkelbacteria bacterium Licking1014_2]|uniref:Putative endonuclease n=1 Tax=Candidatus Berkelbacteria bacterium Licking1014_2 TaxID=2017146 RepID=A0A554LW89_9BACT|nr:MAG: putative endonuclease [Candidatus Berkelbacteria bacterium Licking1014_2]